MLLGFIQRMSLGRGAVPSDNTCRIDVLEQDGDRIVFFGGQNWKIRVAAIFGLVLTAVERKLLNYSGSGFAGCYLRESLE